MELLISFIYGEEIRIEQSRVEELINFSKLLGLSQHFTNPSQTDFERDSTMPIKRKFKSRWTERDLGANTVFSAKKCPSDNSRRRKYDSSFVGKETRVNALNRISRRKRLSIKMRKKFRSNLKKLLKKNASLSAEMDSFPKEEIEICDSKEPIAMPEKASLVIDNYTELWFKSEVPDDSEGKAEKSEPNLPHDGLGKSNFLGSDSNFGSKTCPANPMKRTSRIAMICTVCKASFHRVGDLIKHVKAKLHYSEICSLCFLQVRVMKDG